MRRLGPTGPGSAAARALEAEVERRLGALDRPRKVRLTSGRDQWTTHPEPAIGLRSLTVSDSQVGVRGLRWSEAEPSANTPCAPAIAAAFDPALAEELGRLIGAEARRKGVDVVLGPVLNLQRTPYCGRHFEAYSEDPLLTAAMAAAFVRGVQAEGVATTAKHFIANEAETERLSSNSVVGGRVLRELYLAPFLAVVEEAGALGVMCSYNRVNGTLGSETPLLDAVLKGEWGFDGVVVSDWGAVRSVAGSANAGVDLAMPGPLTPWSRGLLRAVRAGRVAETRLDGKVRRLLRLAARVGALEGIAPLVDRASLPEPPEPAAPPVRRRLRRAAALGTVLVRNEGGLLPLDPARLRRLAVIGPAATRPRLNGGGSAAVSTPPAATPLEAIRAALPGTEVVHAEGVRLGELVRPLGTEFGRAPDGGMGAALVEFLDAAGRVLGQERRRQLDALVYGMGLPAGVSTRRVASYRVRTRISVAEGGDYVLAGGGAGHARISVDGKVRVDRRLVPARDDAVVGMSMPPQATVSLRLRAGQGVDVVFDFKPAPKTVAALRLGFEVAAPPAGALVKQAAELARQAGAAVVLVGSAPEDESEGFDRRTLALGGGQDELVRAVAAANPKTVVVVNSGAPVLVPWREQVPALLLSWFGGQEMGGALADVLTGAVEPGGRLPVTWPAIEGPPLASPFPVDGDVVYSEGLDLGYRGFLRAGVRPAYAFGHGLGYTSWKLAEASVRRRGEGLLVRLTVANTGRRLGRQVVQAYCSRPRGAVPRPLLWYAGSAVVELGPGRSARAEIEISRRALRHWDEAVPGWALEAGEVLVHVGTASDDLPISLRAEVPLKAVSERRLHLPSSAGGRAQEHRSTEGGRPGRAGAEPGPLAGHGGTRR